MDPKLSNTTYKESINSYNLFHTLGLVLRRHLGPVPFGSGAAMIRSHRRDVCRGVGRGASREGGGGGGGRSKPAVIDGLVFTDHFRGGRREKYLCTCSTIERAEGQTLQEPIVLTLEESDIKNGAPVSGCRLCYHDVCTLSLVTLYRIIDPSLNSIPLYFIGRKNKWTSSSEAILDDAVFL